MAVLMVKDENGGERKVSLSPLPFKIGKKAGTNHLVLDHQSVSREHCVITEQDGALLLQDLGSRNGTFLNAKWVSHAEPLSDGAVVRVGPYTMTLRVEETLPEPTTGAAAASPAESGPLRTPVALKRKIHEELITTLDLKHSDLSEKTQEEIRRKTAAAARAAVKKFESDRPDWLGAEVLVKEVVDEAVGLGPLEDLLADGEVDEIMVNGWDKIYCERHGKLLLTPKQFTSNEQVLAVIRRILAPIGRRVDESSPMVDARLADGSRVNAIIPPLCLTGPTITIRKFARVPFTTDDFIRFGSITPPMVEFLRVAVLYRKNCIISGGTGSGKTTLLNILSNFIPSTERIVTIEDAAELQLGQDHVVSLESKPPSIEGKGEVPIRKLVINALRMRPDRIVVGECRGGEALDMLQAMNTGHDGSLTTIHANSPRDVLARLETLVLMAGLDLPARAIREQVAAAISIIVHESRMPDGSRKVVNIAEITGMEVETITMQTIFEYKQTGFDEHGKVLGEHRATGAIPRFIHELRERGVAVDLGIFKTSGG